ncbi:copper transport protein ATX1-like [Asparagus officinalis]|uniref:copper transport protein ATX1-like n=1 Tax=Asparagus officinalis TaxID=4686 RepID=UPI00098E5EAF|nr:copper transport protein ATX1-like [Asparagus officinalis]
MAETVVLKVGMSCQGCVGAVKRVLTKMEGVETFDVNIDEQKVTVKGNVTPDAVLQTVSKTGKKTSFCEAEPETKEAPAAPTAAPFKWRPYSPPELDMHTLAPICRDSSDLWRARVPLIC